MKELLLSNTKDLSIVDGDIQLSDSNVSSLRQRLDITLNTWQGEWVLNINYGIPYRQEIFVAGADKQSVDAIFLREVLRYSEVEEIVEFVSEFNKLTRQYEIVRLLVRTTEGTVENVTLRDPDRYIYTYVPPEEKEVCSFSEISVIMQAGEPTAISGEPDAEAQPL